MRIILLLLFNHYIFETGIHINTSFIMASGISFKQKTSSKREPCSSFLAD